LTGWQQPGFQLNNSGQILAWHGNWKNAMFGIWKNGVSQRASDGMMSNQSDLRAASVEERSHSTDVFLKGLGDDGTMAGATLTPTDRTDTYNAHWLVSGFVWKDGHKTAIGDLIPAAVNSRGQVLCYHAEPREHVHYTADLFTAASTHFIVYDHGKTWELGSLPMVRAPMIVAFNDRGEGLFEWMNAYMFPGPPPLRLDRFGRCWWLNMQPTAINSAGDSIGYSGKKREPLFWSHGTTTSLLQMLPEPSTWSSVDLAGLNNRGQIAGTGWRNGRSCAFLLTPKKRRRI